MSKTITYKQGDVTYEVKGMLRFLGSILLSTFAFIFCLYVWMFPIIGMFLNLYLTIRLIEDVCGVKRTDLAALPIILVSIAIHGALSIGAFILFFTWINAV